MAMNTPLTISASPQTQSWFSKTARLTADGRPQTTAAPTTSGTARERAAPASMSTRVPSSTIAISDESAAQNMARKNSGRNSPPAGMRANTWGIQMKVSPVFPAASASPASPAGRMAKAAGRIAIAASSDATLLPRPIVAALVTTSSLSRT